MLFGGMAHRRAENVAKQVDELGEAIEAVEDQLREVEAPVRAAAVPGMPLPTGYGLQVRGPDDESIVLPGLPAAGFELASMVLPGVLPRDEPAPAPAQHPAAGPRAGPAPAVVGRAHPRAPQRHARVRLRQRPGLQRGPDVRRRRRRRRARPSRPAASRPTTSSGPPVSGDDERGRDDGPARRRGVHELPHREVAPRAQPPETDRDALAHAGAVEREGARKPDLAVRPAGSAARDRPGCAR